MGARGRKPTPTAILKMRGSWRGNINKSEPQSPGMPVCPDWLDEVGRQRWDYVVPLLSDMGVLGKIDELSLERYCDEYSRWRRCIDVIRRKGMCTKTKRRPESIEAAALSQSLARREADFGMTPSARSRITTKPQEAESVGTEAKYLSL